MRNAPLFDLEGVTWTPVSPKLATIRTACTAFGFGLPLGGAIVIALATKLIWPLAFGLIPLGLGLWMIAIVRRQVRNIGYAERDDDFLIRRGVLFRTLSVVPYGRMQYVDVSVGPIARAAGIASLELHTAAVGLNIHLPGLPPEEAARLRDRLASRGQAQLAGL